jgi:hypothetical protein
MAEPVKTGAKQEKTLKPISEMVLYNSWILLSVPFLLPEPGPTGPGKEKEGQILFLSAES